MAPKRKSKAKSKSEPATKRRKVAIAKTADDDRLLTGPQTWSRAPSSSAWSTRVLPSKHVSPLTTLCLGVFAKNLGRLAEKDETFDAIRAWLKLLPDTIVPRLFNMLRSTCPTILSHAFIIAHLLRGNSIILTGELVGVNRHTVLAIGDSPSRAQLHELVLRDLDDTTDSVVASTVAKLPSLQTLVLRGCTKVGPKTAASIAKACPKLTTLNAKYTSITPISIAPILRSCTALEVLKLGGIPNWTDATVTKLWKALDLDNNPEGLDYQ